MIYRSLFLRAHCPRNLIPLFSKIPAISAIKPSSIAFRSFANDSSTSAEREKPINTVIEKIISEKSKKPANEPAGFKKPTNDTDEAAPAIAIGEAKSFFSGATTRMKMAHVDKDKRSHRLGVNEVTEGVAGEKSFEFVDPNAVVYPTLETLKELFGGIPYCELPEIRIYLSKNNTKVSAVDYKGTELFRTSASIEGFKNCKKKTEVAGQTVGVSTGNKCMRRGLTHVRVILSGLGPGRMSCIQGMTTTGVNIVSLSDLSPLPELGPRPRKARRL